MNMHSLSGAAPVADAPASARAPHEVQLWCFFYEAAWAADPSLAAAYDALITPAERERVRAFRFEKDQRQGLAARALVRTVLSHHARVPPSGWRFEASALGKPFIAAPGGHGSLHFNLAHTHGLVVCAVSKTHARLGVDVEALDRRASAADIADQHFTPEENAWLRSVPPESHHHAFMQLWTLKEACIKATGEGLSAALDQVSFTPDEALCGIPRAVPVRFMPPSSEQAAHWRFVQARLQGRFAVALATDTGGQPLQGRVFDTVPLRTHAERTDLAFTAP